VEIGTSVIKGDGGRTGRRVMENVCGDWQECDPRGRREDWVKSNGKCVWRLAGV
jgi:hypothetical protein